MKIIITNCQEDYSDFAELEKLFYQLGEITAKEFLLSADTVVDVILVDDAEMKGLNLEYRGIDATTDVLSFAMQEDLEDETPFPEEDDILLGDVVISFPRAIAQSEEYAHSLERELGFLFIHGLLHLLGYDHQTTAEESTMFAMQEKILQQAGMKRNL